MEERLITCATKYGFRAKSLGENILIFARNIDGCWVTWIKYNSRLNSVCCMGNTDYLNLWLAVTRSDLTPEKVLSFIDELNATLDLRGDARFFVSDLIDPEDWAELANIGNALADPRYVEN